MIVKGFSRRTHPHRANGFEEFCHASADVTVSYADDLPSLQSLEESCVSGK
jgi:hypothetical protein